MEDRQLALDKAKISLMEDPNFLFYTTVGLSLRHVWDESIPTAAVDGTTIFYNTDYFLKQDPKVRKSILVHEIGHVVLDHITRRGDRDRVRWNKAGDYVINLQARDAGCQIPHTWLIDERYRGMSTDEVYDLLPPEPKSGKGDEGESGSGLPADFGSGAPGSEFSCDVLPPKGDPVEAKKQIDDILVQAAITCSQSSKGWGMVPDDVQRYLTDLLNPQLPWHALLRKFYTSFAKSDYTFRKPNRRFFPDHILPTAHSEALGEIAVIVDVSCSVSETEFMHFVSETMRILKSQKPKAIKFVHFDTRIMSVDTVTSVQDLKRVKFRSGGGTYIPPVIEWIKQNKPMASIIFTDGEFTPYEGDCKHPIIWAIYGSKQFSAKFGKTIYFDVPNP